METCKAEMKAKQFSLMGNVNDWSLADLDVDALVAPLELSGVYRVFGIDARAEDYEKLPFPRQADFEARLAEMEAFEIALTPTMTVLHVVRLAALEYARRNHTGYWHIYFEAICVRKDDHTIEFTMGS